MKPYTYLIGWRALDVWYYGVRSAHKTEPIDDLWVSYFTSSQHVKDFRKAHGEPDVRIVHKTFSDKTSAHHYENRFIIRVRACESERWLNRRSSKGWFPKGPQSERHKKKASEALRRYYETHPNPMKGKLVSQETLAKRSKSMLTRWEKPEATQHKDAIRRAHSGKTITEETRELLKEARKKPRATLTCPHCGKSAAGGIMKRWHFDQCKEKDGHLS